MLRAWFFFLCLAAIVCYAGSRVTLYGDVLGEKWSLARTFIGVILLSTITSLPELVTSVASVTFVDAPDLALGNILGSNLFNLFLIPLLALLYGGTYLGRASHHHVRTGVVVLVLYAALAGEFALEGTALLGWRDGPVSPGSLFIFGGYTVGVYLLFSVFHPPRAESLEEVDLYPEQSHGRTLMLFVLFGGAVIVAGGLLAVVGKGLAVSTGLGETFFGSLFFAFVTSLPELIVSWVALRQLEAVNLAMGNVMGSCLFNLAIILPCDLAAPGYGLLAAVGSTHLLGLLGGALMVGVAGTAVLWRTDHPPRRAFSVEMVLLAGLYLATVYLLFVLR